MAKTSRVPASSSSPKPWKWFVFGIFLTLLILIVAAGLLWWFVFNRQIPNLFAPLNEEQAEVVEQPDESVVDQRTAEDFVDRYFVAEGVNIPLFRGWSAKTTESQPPTENEDGSTTPASYVVTIYNSPIQTADHRVARVSLRAKGFEEYAEQIACVVPTPDGIAREGLAGEGDVEDAAYLHAAGIVVHQRSIGDGSVVYAFAEPTETGSLGTSDLCAAVSSEPGISQEDVRGVRLLTTELPLWTGNFIPVTPINGYVGESYPRAFPTEGVRDGVDVLDTRVYHIGDGGALELALASANDVLGTREEGHIRYLLTQVDDHGQIFYFRSQPCYACDGVPTGMYAYSLLGDQLLFAEDEFFGSVEEISPDNRFFIQPVDNGFTTGFDVIEFSTLEAVLTVRPADGESFSPDGAGCPFVACRVMVRWEDAGNISFAVYAWNPEEDLSPLTSGEGELPLIEERTLSLPASHL